MYNFYLRSTIGKKNSSLNSQIRKRHYKKKYFKALVILVLFVCKLKSTTYKKSWFILHSEFKRNDFFWQNFWKLVAKCYYKNLLKGIYSYTFFSLKITAYTFPQSIWNIDEWKLRKKLWTLKNLSIPKFDFISKEQTRQNKYYYRHFTKSAKGK